MVSWFAFCVCVSERRTLNSMAATPPTSPQYVRLGPSHPSTQAFRAYLARILGGTRQEELFSAALQLDRAVVAGSAVFAGALLPGCSWEAGDLDVWAPSPIEHLILRLQNVDVGVPVARLFDNPSKTVVVDDAIEYRGPATRGKWRTLPVALVTEDSILLEERPVGGARGGRAPAKRHCQALFRHRVW